MNNVRGVIAMMSLAQAKKHAERMTKLHGEKWIVFKTPDDALCNTLEGGRYNTGRYAACKESERADYAQGGAEFVA